MITSTSVSADRTTVFIDGANFGRSPLVTVNGQPLTQVTVDASATHIVAALPALPPATCLIEVDARDQPSKSNDSGHSATFALVLEDRAAAPRWRRCQLRRARRARLRARQCGRQDPVDL